MHFKNLTKKQSGDIYITIRLTNSSEIQKLNKEFLQRDYPTDVLSFKYEQDMEEGSMQLGDVVVNIDQANLQAKEYDNDLEHEVADLVAHGVLHLLGVHHADDDEKTVHGLPTNSKPM